MKPITETTIHVVSHHVTKGIFEVELCREITGTRYVLNDSNATKVFVQSQGYLRCYGISSMSSSSSSSSNPSISSFEAPMLLE